MEKVVERVIHVPVPVTRQEHVTRQVMSSTTQHVRAQPVSAGTQVVEVNCYWHAFVAGCHMKTKLACLHAVAADALRIPVRYPKLAATFAPCHCDHL